MVYMHSNRHGQLHALADTWAKHCDYFMAVSNQTDRLLGAVSLWHEGLGIYQICSSKFVPWQVFLVHLLLQTTTYKPWFWASRIWAEETPSQSANLRVCTCLVPCLVGFMLVGICSQTLFGPIRFFHSGSDDHLFIPKNFRYMANVGTIKGHIWATYNRWRPTYRRCEVYATARKAMMWGNPDPKEVFGGDSTLAGNCCNCRTGGSQHWECGSFLCTAFLAS